MYSTNYAPWTLPDAEDTKIEDTGSAHKDLMGSLGETDNDKCGVNATVGATRHYKKGARNPPSCMMKRQSLSRIHKNERNIRVEG